MRVMGDDLKILGKASPRRQFRNISKVIIHPSYSYNDIPLYGSRRNIDIAVLFVSRPNYFLFFFSLLLARDNITAPKKSFLNILFYFSEKSVLLLFFPFRCHFNQLKSPFNETETFGPIELADEVVEVNETCQFCKHNYFHWFHFIFFELKLKVLVQESWI